MEIDTLQALVAVAERGSFSRAAEQLFVTQPAVSKRIAALENELGTALFDRIGHRIVLTEAGRALLPRARGILAAVDDSRRLVANLAGRVSGTLSFGTSHHIGLHRLPPFLRDFSQRYPDVELDIHFMDSEAACNAVEHGELELGVVTLPLNPRETLRTVRVWHDPLAVMVGKDHPLARRRTVRPADLAPYTAILPATGTFTREVVERAFAPLNLQLKVGLSTNYLETIKMMVSVGLGWSILPRTMLDADVRALQLRGVRLQRELGAVRHRDRTLSNAGQALVDLLAAQR
ncbi:MAG: LysR family transcriptional regulator [Gammaproteobacteria bacterium]